MMRVKSMLDEAEELIRVKLGEAEFQAKMTAEPKILMDMLDRMEKLAKARGGGEEFKKTLNELCKGSPEAVLALVGKMNRARLRNALDEWEE